MKVSRKKIKVNPFLIVCKEISPSVCMCLYVSVFLVVDLSQFINRPKINKNERNTRNKRLIKWYCVVIFTDDWEESESRFFAPFSGGNRVRWTQSLKTPSVTRLFVGQCVCVSILKRNIFFGPRYESYGAF